MLVKRGGARSGIAVGKACFDWLGLRSSASSPRARDQEHAFSQRVPVRFHDAIALSIIRNERPESVTLLVHGMMGRHVQWMARNLVVEKKPRRDSSS